MLSCILHVQLFKCQGKHYYFANELKFYFVLFGEVSFFIVEISTQAV